jgi:hypothetical protein
MTVLDLAFSFTVRQLEVLVCFLTVTIVKIATMFMFSPSDPVLGLALIIQQVAVTYLRGPTELAQTTTSSRSLY